MKDDHCLMLPAMQNPKCHAQQKERKENKKNKGKKKENLQPANSNP